jgi:hypothetical protein
MKVRQTTGRKSKFRNHHAAGVKKFVWRTQKGILQRPADMTTRHLFNTIKMLRNHEDNPGKGKGYVFYPNVATWSTKYRNRALKELVEEIRTRSDYNEKELFTVML